MMPRTHILAIAVENYQDASIDIVEYAENDAKQFVAAWQELGVAKTDCVTLLSSQATFATVISRLKILLRNANSNERIIFFYAGHGATFSGVSHITVHDTHPKDSQNTSISLTEILSMVRDSKIRQVLLFLDSCHSGLPICTGMRSIYTAFTGEELVAFCKDAEFHLAFASCKNDEYSYPSRSLKHGIWTYCVIQAIKGNAKAALENESVVTASSLQGYLSDEVPRIFRKTIAGGSSQTPCMWGNTTKELVVADLGELLRVRRLAEVTPVNIIKESTLLGEERGLVRTLSDYRRPLSPLSTHSQWEQNFVKTSGETEVKNQATEIFDKVKVRSLFGYKRKDLIFANDGSSATIKTPDFDVNISLSQHPVEADKYVLKTEVASFRRPEIINDVNFLKTFTKYCDSVVIELASELDIEAKIDEIEDVKPLAAGLEYDAECTEFTLRLPDSGIVLHATSSRIVFSLDTRGDLETLIRNTHMAVDQLAGNGVTLGLPDSSKS